VGYYSATASSEWREHLEHIWVLSRWGMSRTRCARATLLPENWLPLILKPHTLTPQTGSVYTSPICPRHGFRD
jgi:hypothetical protein